MSARSLPGCKKTRLFWGGGGVISPGDLCVCVRLYVGGLAHRTSVLAYFAVSRCCLRLLLTVVLNRNEARCGLHRKVSRASRREWVPPSVAGPFGGPMLRASFGASNGVRSGGGNRSGIKCALVWFQARWSGFRVAPQTDPDPSPGLRGHLAPRDTSR